MFGISGEHLLILGIVLLIFGPRRLPELGHTLGKCVRNFKDALAGIEEAKFQRLEDQNPQATALRSPSAAVNGAAGSGSPVAGSVAEAGTQNSEPASV
ncbi:MAG: hypothetical protein RJB38_2149 [Pseudomonadota bacterium]|jgi:TatA/E family protein of Tat protein translocase